MRIQILGLALAAGLAAGHSAAAAPAYPCDRIAAELRALDARHVRLEGWFVAEALAKRKASPIRARTDFEDSNETGTLPARLKALGLPMSAFPELEDVTHGAVIRRAGPLGVVQVADGNLNCNSYSFFETGRGRGRRIGRPPQMPKQGKEGGLSYCYTQSGWVGFVDNKPAFIDETMVEGDNHSTIRVSLWQGGRWSAACRLENSYSPVFKVSDFGCKLGKACPALKARAEDMARRIEANPRIVKTWAGQASSPKAKRMMALAKAQTAVSFDIDGNTFDLDPDAAVFPIDIGGTTYLARMGVAVQGEKSELADNLFIYDLDKDRLVPVAGASIERQRGRLKLLK